MTGTPSNRSSFVDQAVADIQPLRDTAMTGPDVRYRLTWRDVYYEVPDKGSGGVKQVLCGVSGHVAPGQATH